MIINDVPDEIIQVEPLKKVGNGRGRVSMCQFYDKLL